MDEHQKKIHTLLIQGGCFCDPDNLSSLRGVLTAALESVKHPYNSVKSLRLDQGSHEEDVPNQKGKLLVSLSFLQTLLENDLCFQIHILKKKGVDWLEIWKNLMIVHKMSDISSYLCIQCAVNILQSGLILDLEAALSSVSPRKVVTKCIQDPENHGVLTFALDLLHISLKLPKIPKCQTPEKCPCFKPNHEDVDSISRNSEGLMEILERVVVQYLPVFKTFLLARGTSKDSDLEDQHTECKGENYDLCNVQHISLRMWVISLDIDTFDSVLFAFLKLFKSFAKKVGHQNVKADIARLTLNLLKNPNCVARKTILMSLKIIEVYTKLSLREKVQSETDPDSIQVKASNIPSSAISILQQSFSLFKEEWIDMLPVDKGPFGFGGTIFARVYKNPGLDCCDSVMLRKLLSVLIDSFSYLVGVSTTSHLESMVSSLENALTSLRCKVEHLPAPTDSNVDWIVNMFADKDDALIDICMKFMNIFETLTVKKKEGISSCDVLPEMNPHVFFWRFLNHLSCDHSVLLDLLMSSETDFVSYFVRYLRFSIANWGLFVKCLNDVVREDDVLSDDHDCFEDDSDSGGQEGDCDDTEGSTHGLQKDSRKGESYQNALQLKVKFFHEDPLHINRKCKKIKKTNVHQNICKLASKDNQEKSIQNQAEPKYNSEFDFKPTTTASKISSPFSGCLSERCFKSKSREPNVTCFANITPARTDFVAQTESSDLCRTEQINDGVSLTAKILHESFKMTENALSCKDVHFAKGDSSIEDCFVIKDGSSNELAPLDFRITDIDHLDDDTLKTIIPGSITTNTTDVSGTEPAVKKLKFESDDPSEKDFDTPLSEEIEDYVDTALDHVMTIFIRLRLSLERLQQKGLLPYDVNPLIKLIAALEDKYEDT